MKYSSQSLRSAIPENRAFLAKFSEPSFRMTNDKFSMTNFQFSLSALVATCRAASSRLMPFALFLSLCRATPALFTHKSTHKSAFAAAATRQVRHRQKPSSPFSRTLSLTQRVEGKRLNSKGERLPPSPQRLRTGESSEKLPVGVPELD